MKFNHVSLLVFVFSVKHVFYCLPMQVVKRGRGDGPVGLL
jgi:hypothetical protein